jgi:cytochrome c peroxidase
MPIRIGENTAMFHRHLPRSGGWLRLVVAVILLAIAGGGSAQQAALSRADGLVTQDASGWLQTSRPDGKVDRHNPFFRSLGSNGRSCNSCHQQQDGWTISAVDVRKRFKATRGLDPIFRPVDGANSPLADVSTFAARQSAYSMLLDHGVIRVGLPIPAHAEFTLIAVDDPYHYASASELSLFRRPLPATNLIWDTAMMWDGRETFAPFQPPMDAGIDHEDIRASLESQALHAVLGHEQAAAAPDQLTLKEIAEFEVDNFTAQYADRFAGRLNEDDGMGGADILAQQKFWVGINDALDNDPTGDPFDPKVMRLFGHWLDPVARSNSWQVRRRIAIARGERLFDSMPIAITGVAGLNDVTGKPVIHGTCGTCHDSPNIGNHSVGAPLDIGIADANRRTPDMPLYTLANLKTGQIVQTTDPGFAMITGKWADIGKFKGPNLRGLAARAPYFHNGSAATLRDVVDFYDTRFHIGMTEQQKGDLVAFLSAL